MIRFGGPAAGVSVQSKCSERDIFEVFLRLCPGAPLGIVEYGDKPDVLVRTADGGYGFEITQIFHSDLRGRSAMVCHSQCDAIVALAKRACSEERLRHLFVSVSFAFNRHIPKSTWDLVAGQLANIVASHAPAPGARAQWLNDYSGQWSEAMESVEIANFPALYESMWTHEGAGWAHTDIACELQAAIDAKARLLPTYLQRCDRCALIVAAGGIPGVSAMMPDLECLSRIYTSPFDATYFVGVRDARCARLETSP